jgi:hypothetical protein
MMEVVLQRSTWLSLVAMVGAVKVIMVHDGDEDFRYGWPKQIGGAVVIWERKVWVWKP